MSQGFGMSRTKSLLNHNPILHKAATNPEAISRVLKISKETVQRYAAKRIANDYSPTEYTLDASTIESRNSPFEWLRLSETIPTLSTPVNTGAWKYAATASNISIADIYEVTKTQADKVRATMLRDAQQLIGEFEE